MNNKEVTEQAIKLYFEGGNWQMYLKKQAREKESFKELLKKIVK